MKIEFMLVKFYISVNNVRKNKVVFSRFAKMRDTRDHESYFMFACFSIYDLVDSMGFMAHFLFNLRALVSIGKGLRITYLKAFM